MQNNVNQKDRKITVGGSHLQTILNNGIEINYSSTQ